MLPMQRLKYKLQATKSWAGPGNEASVHVDALLVMESCTNPLSNDCTSYVPEIKTLVIGLGQWLGPGCFLNVHMHDIACPLPILIMYFLPNHSLVIPRPSQTSKQRTLREQYKFKSFVLCRGCPLRTIGKPIIWDLEKRPL